MKIKTVVVGSLNTNCYILENDYECLIIDPGDDFFEIKKNINKRVVGILITHNHFDHVGAVEDCNNFYRTKVYDKSNLEEGYKRINSFYFKVIYNPGHTLDSISFLFDNNLFCGDFIFKDGIGRCDLGGDYNLMIKSIKKLLDLNLNYKLFPGHGEPTTISKEINLKKYVENY